MTLTMGSTARLMGFLTLRLRMPSLTPVHVLMPVTGTVEGLSCCPPSSFPPLVPEGVGSADCHTRPNTGDPNLNKAHPVPAGLGAATTPAGGRDPTIDHPSVWAF